MRKTPYACLVTTMARLILGFDHALEVASRDNDRNLYKFDLRSLPVRGLYKALDGGIYGRPIFTYEPKYWWHYRVAEKLGEMFIKSGKPFVSGVSENIALREVSYFHQCLKLAKYHFLLGIASQTGCNVYDILEKYIISVQLLSKGHGKVFYFAAKRSYPEIIDIAEQLHKSYQLEFITNG
jgi:hypothetical protein